MKQSLKEYLQNSIDSEERVYNFLLSLCTNDESIEIERKSLQFIPNELTAGKYIPDSQLKSKHNLHNIFDNFCKLLCVK